MANGKIRFGKQSGGQLALVIPDGASNTNLVLPESGTLVSVGTTVTDNAIARFDGITGAVQNSGVTIDDSGNIGVSGSSYPNITLTNINSSSTFPLVALQDLRTNAHSWDIEVGRTIGALSFRDNEAGDGVFERMIIDSAGNVGIGVTPSAWAGWFKSIDIGSGSLFSSPAANEFGIGDNFYYDVGGAYRYKRSTSAACYQQGLGQHTWKTAPSGIAGNPITWTSAMTLGSNGNLLVGTSTDNGVDKLQVNGSISSGRVSSVTDLNEVKINGLFVTGDFSFSVASNAPCEYGTLHQIARSVFECTQMVIDVVTGKLYTRVYLGTTWPAWVEK